MHKVRLTAHGFERFTGELAGGTRFVEGLSVDKVNPILANRIGAGMRCIDDDTGEQLGPSAAMLKLHGLNMTVGERTKTADRVKADEKTSTELKAERLAAEEKAEAERIAAEAEALAAAREKAEADTPQVWTRLELEALGADKGIGELRKIGEPMEAKGRSVNEMIVSILRKQTAKLAQA